MKRNGMKLLSLLLICSLLATFTWIPAFGAESDADASTGLVAGLAADSTEAGSDSVSSDDGAEQSDAAADRCEQLLANMTLEDKISQMLMPSFRYVTTSEGKSVGREAITDDVVQILNKRGFAGVILFGDNLKSTEKAVTLIHDLQTANAAGENRPQLLIAADQEGGIVTRLGQGTQMPGNMALGAVGDTKETQQVGTIIGQELISMGINYDAAPVVDVNNNPANPVIGVRSFSDDPQVVAEQGKAFMKGLQSTGVISTLKHFPGHGDTDTDSHTGLPSVNRSYDELKQRELVPFQACIDARAEAIMTAHIEYPQIETETAISKKNGETITLPATLSKTILTDILRNDMGYEGVVITDAMDMDAINEHFGKLDAARLAINAGVDIILMPVDTATTAGIQALDEYVTNVAKMVEEGQISMDNVNASVLRVLRLKEAHGLLEAYDTGNLDATLHQANNVVGSPASHEEEWRITKRSITLLKNEGKVLPLTKEGQKIAVLTSGEGMNLGLNYAVSRVEEEGKLASGTEVTIQTPSGSTAEEKLASVRALMDGADQVIVVSSAGSLTALNPEVTAWSKFVDQAIDAAHAGGKTATLLSVRLPYDAARYQTADAILLAWSYRVMSEDPRQADSQGQEYGPNMPAALYMMLTGESLSGKLPVNVPAIDGDYQYTDQILYARGSGLNWTASSGSKNNGGSKTEEPAADPSDENCPLKAYTDVDVAAWYHDGVHWALEKGIMNGTSATTFEPDADTTRAMIVTILWRMAGSPAGTAASGSFTDLEAGSWYETAVNWAAENGIVNGYDAVTFGPQDPISREQFAAILYRFGAFQKLDTLESRSRLGSEFYDANQVSDWAFDAMSWANAQGILTGVTETTLVPQGKATRAQAATLLMRYSK